jgi:hypothetical protein
MPSPADSIYTDSPTAEIVFYHDPLIGVPPQEFTWSAVTRHSLRRAYVAIDHGDLQTFLQLHEEVGIAPRQSRLEEFAVESLLHGNITEALRAYEILGRKIPAAELAAARALAASRNAA